MGGLKQGECDKEERGSGGNAILVGQGVESDRGVKRGQGNKTLCGGRGKAKGKLRQADIGTKGKEPIGRVGVNAKKRHGIAILFLSLCMQGSMAICKPSEPAGDPPEYEVLMEQVKGLRLQLAKRSSRCRMQRSEQIMGQQRSTVLYLKEAAARGDKVHRNYHQKMVEARVMVDRRDYRCYQSSKASTC